MHREATVCCVSSQLCPWVEGERGALGGVEGGRGICPLTLTTKRITMPHAGFGSEQPQPLLCTLAPVSCRRAHEQCNADNCFFDLSTPADCMHGLHVGVPQSTVPHPRHPFQRRGEQENAPRRMRQYWQYRCSPQSGHQGNLRVYSHPALQKDDADRDRPRDAEHGDATRCEKIHTDAKETAGGVVRRS